MNKREYAEIAAACDRLLRARDTSVARIAIPFLHVINEHPGCLRQYEPLLRPQAASNAAHTGQFFAGAVGNAVRAGRTLARSLSSRSRQHAGFDTRGGVTVLIVSHLSHPSQLATESDFYFGELASLLSVRGCHPSMALVDHLASVDARRQCAMHPASTRRWIIPPTVPAAIETRIWLRCALVRRQLRQAARSSHSELDAAVAMLASRHAFAGDTAANLRLHAAVADICRRLNPAIVITTHEGTAAERIIWHAARSGGRQPLCVGYQHTRLLEYAHAIRRPVAAPDIACDPDVILTLGEITQLALAASPGLGSVQLINFGSHRRSRSTMPMQWHRRMRQCLVISDADDDECARLFEFALECARRDGTTTYVLRPHPLVRFAELQNRHPALRELPANVRISTGATLEHECLQSRYCLYRGSSAVLHAVLNGVKPYYLARAGELTIDPLYALGAWREVVVTSEDLRRRLDAAEASPDVAAAQRAWEYCDHYVSPVRPEALDELLDNYARHATSRHSFRSSSASTSAISSAK